MDNTNSSPVNIDTSIKLVLTIDEVNAVLASLGEQKYTAVAQLIQNIREQGVPQAERIQEQLAQYSAQQPAEPE